MKLFIVMLAASLFLVGCPQAKEKPTVNKVATKIKKIKKKKKFILTKKQKEELKKILELEYKKTFGEELPD